MVVFSLIFNRIACFSRVFHRSGGFFVDFSSKWWFFRGFFVDLVVFSLIFRRIGVFSLIFRRIGGFFVDCSPIWCKYAEKSASDSKILQNAMKINDFAWKN